MTKLQGQNNLELILMESVVDVLAVLSIPDKQVLNETGIWQIISRLDAGADVEVINEVSRQYNLLFCYMIKEHFRYHIFLPKLKFIIAISRGF